MLAVTEQAWQLQMLTNSLLNVIHGEKVTRHLLVLVHHASRAGHHDHPTKLGTLAFQVPAVMQSNGMGALACECVA